MGINNLPIPERREWMDLGTQTLTETKGAIAEKRGVVCKLQRLWQQSQQQRSLQQPPWLCNFLIAQLLHDV